MVPRRATTFHPSSISDGGGGSGRDWGACSEGFALARPPRLVLSRPGPDLVTGARTGAGRAAKAPDTAGRLASAEVGTFASRAANLPPSLSITAWMVRLMTSSRLKFVGCSGANIRGPASACCRSAAVVSLERGDGRRGLCCATRGGGSTGHRSPVSAGGRGPRGAPATQGVAAPSLGCCCA